MELTNGHELPVTFQEKKAKKSKEDGSEFAQSITVVVFQTVSSTIID